MYKYEDISNNKIVHDYDAVLNCVNNILNTQKGSLQMKRDFGINLEKYLFDPFEPYIANLIKAEIHRSILINCKAIEKLHIKVIPNLYLETYEVEIGIKAKYLDNTITTNLKLKKI